MNKTEIEIGDKKYNVQIAKTEDEMAKGLQGVKELPDNEGMLFCFEKPEEQSFWMEDTLIPLDIIFINEDNEVIKVQQGAPMSKEAITCKDVLYVLEVNAGSGIKIEDELDYDEEDNSEDSKMYVIGPKGKIQMELEGNERIFSRNNTKQLVKMSKKAYKSKNERDYKALGKKLFKYINTHNTQDPDYVEIKS